MAEESEITITSVLKVFKDCSESDSLKTVNLKSVIKLLGTFPEHIKVKDLSNYEDLLAVIEAITVLGLVKDFSEKEDRDYDDRDFVGVAESAKQCFVCLKSILTKLHIEFQEPEKLYSILIHILKLCGTHSQVFLWSSDEVVKLSDELMQDVLKLTESSSITALLCRRISGCDNTLFKMILLCIRPALTKKTWTRNPSTCQIFKWLLFHVKHPYLRDYLTDVLPPSLMFIDHHAVRNKVLGIQCLDLIIDNVPPTELKMYGRADVVCDALFHLVYMRESDIVRVLYPCILKLMSGQEKNHSNPSQPRKWCRCDDIYQQFLWNMELEDNIMARREMSLIISSFIDHLGITVLKHLKRTKKVLLGYLSIWDGPEEISRINTLKALTLLIQVAWPRMEHHCEDIVKSVYFLVYDIETGSSSIPKVKETLLNCCKECLLCLKSACPSKTKALILSLDDVPKDIPGIQFLHHIFEDSI